MRNFRTVHLLGIGVLTPALTGNSDTAGARSVDLSSTNRSEIARDATVSVETSIVLGLMRELSTFSLAEKLKIAGDTIRTAAATCGTGRSAAGVTCKCKSVRFDCAARSKKPAGKSR